MMACDAVSMRRSRAASDSRKRIASSVAMRACSSAFAVVLRYSTTAALKVS
jgi:hypothetical protein